MSKQQLLFNIYGNASFHANDEKHAYEKLGKYFLSKARKPEVEFENIFYGQLELINLTEDEGKSNE
jgi:hypothetical protein